MSLQLAGCVILDQNQKIYLLHRNKNGITQWELPGGKVEPGESSEAAAKRELREELGICVSIVRSLGATKFVENNIEHVYTWFLAEIESGQPEIKEPETFNDLQSFAIGELPALQLSSNMRKLREAIVSGNVVTH